MAGKKGVNVRKNKRITREADQYLDRMRARMPKEEAAAPEKKEEGLLNQFVNYLLDVDQAAADKFRGRITGDTNMDAYRRDAQGMSIRDINKQVSEMGEPESQVERFLKPAMVATPYATNIGARYALPLGGVTLAGKALVDLTAALSPADYQEQGQIRMS